MTAIRLQEKRAPYFIMNIKNPGKIKDYLNQLHGAESILRS
jgi:hypothetical protein